MSFQATADAIKCKTGSHATKHVLLILASFADENNECFPSIKKISEYSEIPERSVHRAIKNLRENGFLTVEQRYRNGKQTSSKYRLSLWHSEEKQTAKSALQTATVTQPDCHGGIQNKSLEPITEYIPPLVPPKGNSNATRLDENWEPSSKDREYAIRNNWTAEEIDREAENFVEHFTNGNGRKQTSPDWSKRWFTWVRKNYGKNGRNDTARRRAGLAAAYETMGVHVPRASPGNGGRTRLFGGCVEPDASPLRQEGGNGNA